MGLESENTLISLAAGRKPVEFLDARKRTPLGRVVRHLEALAQNDSLTAKVDGIWESMHGNWYEEIDLSDIQTDAGYSQITKGNVESLAAYSKLKQKLKNQGYILRCDVFHFTSPHDIVTLYIWKDSRSS